MPLFWGIFFYNHTFCQEQGGTIMLENIKTEFEKIKFPQLTLRKNGALPEDKEVTEIEPYDREVQGEIVDLKMFLFTWDEIPGNDDEKLRDFLNKNYSLDWLEIAGIEKNR